MIETPVEIIEDLRRARRLEWWTLFWVSSVIAVMAFAMGSSQAMKTAFVEDLLSLIPAITFLIAAKLEPRVNQIVSTLRRGEPDRAQLTKPRWQAGYDLAMGRALAAKVRTEGYNAMLAAAKQGLQFKNPRNDTWVLRPTRDVTVNSALAKDAAAATAYLKRVLDEHPGTPWADVPMNWTCPECGARKEDFEMVQL